MIFLTITFPFLGDNFAINPSKYFIIPGINMKIHWYGVIIAVGFVLGVIYAFKRRKTFGFTENEVIDMVLIAAPSAIVGARLYYVILHFAEDFKAPTVWQTIKNIVAIWKGGSAIYGGILLAVIFIFIYCRRKKIAFGAMLDIASLGLIIGEIIGRWGNFINREILGTSANVNTFVFRMGLTNSIGITTYYHPLFLYESVWNFIGFIMMHFMVKRRKYDGQIFCFYLIWYGIGRFFMDFLRIGTPMINIFGIQLRAFQIFAVITVIIAGAYMIYMKASGRTGADRLYVNRVSINENSKAE